MPTPPSFPHLFDPRPPLKGRNDSDVALHAITYRQLQCLAWVQEGKSAGDIGVILGISGRTVDSHLARLCEHLGVRTRLQAVLKARELDLLPLPHRRDTAPAR